MKFTRQQRLISKAEFDHVFLDARKVSLKHMLALYKPNNLPLARMGVIIGKKVAVQAVDRNRFKRITRESFRLNQEQLSGWDIVIIAKTQCATLTNIELRKGIEDLWKKLLKQVQTSSSS